MGKGDISRRLKDMSPEDQRTFDRWLYANAAVSLIFAAGIVAMVVAASSSAGPRDATAAIRTKAPDIGAAASEQRREQVGSIRSHRAAKD